MFRVRRSSVLRRTVGFATAVLIASAGVAVGQVAPEGAKYPTTPPGGAPAVPPHPGDGVPMPMPTEPIVIVPQVRRHHLPERYRAVELTAVGVNITIDAQVSTTTMELTLTNGSPVGQSVELVLPVPDGVTVRSMEYDGVGPEPVARILPRDEARRQYDDIVRRTADPALLEFAGYNLIRTSVFPVPARGSQKLRVTYEQVLASDMGRVDFVLPRSESLQASGAAWNIQATIKSKDPVSTVYSPSHDIATDRLGPGHLIVRVTPGAARNPGSFRLSYLSLPGANDGISASLIAYPDATVAGEGGYFMLLAGLPATPARDAAPVKREVILVIDRSGSMRGEKIEQVREAVLQVIAGLNEGEAFNIIDYSDSINTFSDKAVVKTVESAARATQYVKAIQAGGGTNLHDALMEALRPEPTAGTLPMVLFLTDGLPTVGIRSEESIREAAKAANKFNRRVFTFGVGFDVNTPLLSAIARGSRGAPTFVQPQENVEVKVSQVFRRLSGPVLASPRLTFLDAGGKVITTAARDLQPADLPDLFEGDQMVLLGKYMVGGPLRARLEGEFLGKPRSFDFTLSTKEASLKNAYVPRLWASRKIAMLVDQIRQSGATPPTPGQSPTDARMKELVDEIVRLSMQFGILTEYTSFLAAEPARVADGGMPMAPGLAGGGGGGGGPMAPSAAPVDYDNYHTTLEVNLRRKAVQERSGGGSAVQDVNLSQQREQQTLNYSNTQACLTDGKFAETSFTACQQVADRTLFRRGGRWVESSMLEHETKEPQQTIKFGTEEFSKLLDRLTRENRQGLLAMGGELYLMLDGQRVLVQGL